MNVARSGNGRGRPVLGYLTDARAQRALHRRLAARFAAVGAVVALLVATGLEMRESRLQAWLFSEYVRPAGWRLAPGPADSIWFPAEGPYPARLGYSRLPALLPRLAAQGFDVALQARQSGRFREIVERGLNPVYAEKTQAGLTILDRAGRPLYRRRFPAWQYARFEDIPDLVVGALLFIENRDLLDPDRVARNPAVDWGRLARAAAGQGLKSVSLGGGRAGGSTLATQIEKFRYSPGGRTQDAEDKLRQMISAALRAYHDGPHTLAARRRIVLDYLNAVPLGGVPRHGEVIGFGDGLAAWFGRDFGEANRLLADRAAPVALRARAFREALTLLVAQRRPSGMLAADDDETLERLTNRYLHLLFEDGLIDAALRDATLAVRVDPAGAPRPPRDASFVERKAVNEVRRSLAELLQVADAYALDRHDLEAQSTIDGAAQAAVTEILGRLAQRDFLRCAGLLAPRLLARGDPAGVRYSIVVHESTPLGNLLRVQADNLDQPLDLVGGTKLDLGSSAKLRTLVSYLNVVADLHRRYAALDRDALAALRPRADEAMTAWAVGWLRDTATPDLEAMLEAAMQRRYPADPKETFITGGGIHKFGNFRREDDRTTPTVAEALEQSVNLSFVRIMRDVAHYHAYEAADAPARGLREGDAAVRQAFLDRWGEREGLGLLRTYWHRYRDVPPAERLDLLADAAPQKRGALAAAFLAVRPHAGADALTDFLQARLGAAAGDAKALQRLHAQLAGDRLPLSDLGYLARVHPLQLWLVRHLETHPAASLRDIVPASVEARRQTARWLLAPRFHKELQQRLDIVVEVAAFERLAEEWKRLGYPFDQLVPSLATAIGSSADRPAALAELIGILVHDGVRRPAFDLGQLRFAAGTPYETLLLRRAGAGERVLAPEVARVARRALRAVVERGTARRVRDAFASPDGQPLAVGGKTGTGDHRAKVVDAAGEVLSARVMNRAATFAFFVGERHYGVVTAFVPGAAAAAYDFTSALPVHVLRELAPALQPLFADRPPAPHRCAGAAPAGPLPAPGGSG